ncbi:acetyltransferase, GNAT family [Aeromicrobium marinum DSM 15272]|uniref:Acetyltransferase, GNAT family n=1 Tax=Aeromicrobium marinum DSM 15272 TaxID=585531 RepID=E2SE29_9ACTN|nr:GNAT family N-acetyltransferase [Aeromicrobium marinum]EFQ82756.1 acetyltransferase, GNAT family [Aeromicrobium marinum DSM 15272]
MTVIETERLLLRDFTAADADFVLDLFGRLEVARWSGDGRPLTRRDEAVDRIAGYRARAGDHPAAAIRLVELEDGRAPVGMVLVVPIPPSRGRDGGDHEVGWHVLPDAWGHGYATEAATALVDRAFTAGLPEVHAVTHPDNLRSQAVCRRLGMADLGLCDCWYDRELRAFRLRRP